MGSKPLPDPGPYPPGQPSPQPAPRDPNKPVPAEGDDGG